MGEGGTNGVNRDACTICREGINGRIDDLQDKNDSFMETITELKVISARQLLLQEQNSKMLEKLEDRQNKLEVLVREKAVGEDKVWKQPWFKVVVITACFVFVLIVGAAVGVNAFKEWQQVVTIKP